MSHVAPDIFGFMPNWADGVQLTYSLNTVLTAAERYKEQRKPLRAAPNVNESFELLVDQKSNQVIDYLRYSLQTPMWVPIFPEQLVAEQDGQGLTFIATSGNIPTETLWYLRNMARYVIMIDKEGDQPPALVELTGLGSFAVLLADNDYVVTAGCTMIFPAMDAILSSVVKTFETPYLAGYSLEFDSYTSGQDKSIDAADSDDEVLSIKPDWISRPSMDFPFGRDVVQYDAATTRYRPLTTNLPWQVRANWTNLERSEEYSLIDFFCRHHGMHQRFWFEVPEQYYRLGEYIYYGDTQVSMADSNFQYVYQGYERFFMLLKNGLKLARKLVSKVYDWIYEVSTAFGIDIALEDVSIFGRYLLCRFDQDEIALNYTSPGVSDCGLSIRELPHEYDVVPTLVADFGWDSSVEPGGEWLDADVIPPDKMPLVIIDRSSGAKYYTYNFGDNSCNNHEAEPYHTYEKEGQYCITQVIENAGETHEIKKCLTIANLAPVAYFDMTASYPGAGTNMTRFDNGWAVEAQMVNGSTGDNLTYHWDFGDGFGESTDENPSHPYTSDSPARTITLTVTNEHGSSQFQRTFEIFHSDCISWWKGEGNANDYYGRANMTWHTTEEYRAGVLGQAFKFNPYNPSNPGRAALRNPDGDTAADGRFVFDLSSNFTIECYVLRTEIGANPDDVVFFFAKGLMETLDIGNEDYAMGMDENGKIRCWLGTPNQPIRTVNRVITQANRWYHVAWTYSFGDNHIFIDGVEKPITNQSQGLIINPHSGTELSICYEKIPEAFYFKGGIDEVKVFDTVKYEAQL